MPTDDVDQIEPGDRSLLTELGRHLREIRESQGLSQDSLSNASGLHRTYVGAVERGERNPTYLTLQRYARGLGLSLTDLIKGL